MMKKIIDDHELPQSFSAEDIMELVQGKANLVVHPDIAHYQDIDELLGKNSACIILYVTREGEKPNSLYGHWCCIFRNTTNGMLTYFDPYGCDIDETVAFMEPEVISEFGQVPELTNLLDRSPSEPIDINQHDFQRHKKGVSTCGRHTGLRLQFRNLNNDEYASMIKPISVDDDELVTLMTSFIK